MAGLPSIETGYKPEFALGALYQGMNAANADMSAQEELIRQFLANQRDAQMLPRDVAIKDFEANKATAQNTPELLKAFVDSTKAKYDTDIRANELGAAKHPYEMQKVPLFGKRDVDIAGLEAERSHALARLSSGVGDNGLDLGTPLRDDLTARVDELNKLLGNTPQHYADIDKENVKGEWDLKKQRLSNAGSANAASIGANKGQQTAYIQAAAQIAANIRNIDSNLARLDGAEAKNEIMQAILASGGQPTPQNIAQEQNKLKEQYMREKQAYMAQFQAYHKAAGMPVPQESQQPTQQPQSSGDALQAAILAELNKRSLK